MGTVQGFNLSSGDWYLLYAVLACGVVGVIAALVWRSKVLAKDQGTDLMKSISGQIQEGAYAYLNRQFRTIAMMVVILIVLLFLTVIGQPPAIMAGRLIAFLLGAFFSGFTGYMGMTLAVRGNVRCTQAARTSLAEALFIAFRAGSVTGMFTVSLGLIGAAVIFMIFKEQATEVLLGFGFGGSLLALFMRVGGGIYTKAADVGADLVGKVEAGIPEDDPRNAAVIADNVGDNVGDCAGMAADLFETYCVTTVAAMLLGHLILGDKVPGAVTFPLLMGAFSIVASIVGSWLVGLGKVTKDGIMRALYLGMGAAGVLALIGFWFISHMVFDSGQGIVLPNGTGAINATSVFVCALVGIVITGAITFITEYYTGTQFSPVQRIAAASQTGHATNMIAGLAVSMQGTALPAIVIVLGILISYGFAGVYGVGIAVMSMLSMAGIVVAIDSFGPITDNAGGIAEMADMPEDVRNVTDPLDAVGNTTKAVTKGYAIGSAALAAVVLFASFLQELINHKCVGAGDACAAGITNLFAIGNPYVLTGLFIGGLLPYLFASLSMEAVGRAGGAVVEEVRRQFREIPGIMEGTTKPDYGTTVDIVTRSALKEMIVPALIPVGVPVIVVLLSVTNVLKGDTGAQMMGGILVGSIVTGFFVAISMTTGGGAWDNAKKYIEDGHFGGKGSVAHQAAVTGDTVGDPYKDTAGPAINPMIKVLNIVALLLVAFLVH